MAVSEEEKKEHHETSEEMTEGSVATSDRGDRVLTECLQSSDHTGGGSRILHLQLVIRKDS